ncbi:MAG: prolyl oligopeptidase family serine peptidase [Rhodomicrobium sp.]
MERKLFAFGHWPSPIPAASVAEGALRFGRVQVFDDAVYWSESRPAEKGRAPVMRWSEEGGVSDILPPPYSARSRVHEYGGGEFLAADGRLFFVNDADQDVYEAGLTTAAAGTGIRRLTNLPATRFADFAFDSRRKRLIGVGETHSLQDAALPENALWAIPAGQGADAAPARLLMGHDFYASPRLSADGSRLAFLAWDLPAMPWDAAQLYAVDIAEDGSPGETAAIAGGNGSACFQPEWGEDGTLYFVWDADGLGSLFAWQDDRSPRKVTHLDADLSMPLWSLNAASFALLSGDRAYCTYVKNGEAGAAIVGLGTPTLQPHGNGFTAMQTLSAGAAGIAVTGLKDEEPLCIALDKVPASAQGSPAILRRSSSAPIGEDYISRPSRLEIPSGKEAVHGLLYGPQNPEAHGPEGALPPLIVNLHGGPTSAALRGLKPRTLFFTSRGFSWLDLDYAGSTGYGRSYRERLKGNWGIADVEDTICAARFAAETGLADPRAIFVTGGSAGGYTVLMAIAGSKIFRGAASYYGISDLIALQKTTHKFEQGYQQALLGASLEEDEAVYRERSAIHHIGRIGTPLILFQGADDNVVPKNQSIAIAAALRAKGVPVEYHEFAGEGHGFRHADTIRACLERELGFYLKLIGDGTGEA